MQIAALGVSGPSGKPFIEQALASGHTVTALVRDASKVPARDGLTLVVGDAMDAAKVEEVIAGADAVVSYLGPKKGAAPNLLEVTTQHIIRAAQKHGVRRVVIASVAGVAMPEDPKGFFSRVMTGVLKIVLKNLFQQRLKQIEMLRASGLEWVALRLPRLTDGPAAGDFAIGYPMIGPKLVVSRADLATAMLQQLVDNQWIGKAPIIG